MYCSLFTRPPLQDAYVEAKVSDLSISPSLKYFHELLKPEFSFQVVQNKQAIDSSCFDKPGLWIVPAITFLSQLK